MQDVIVNPLVATETDTQSSIVELRRYRLHPGTRETLIELFERELVETQEAVGMRVIGQFRDLDAPDDFVWFRGFSDMPSRAEALQSFYTGPVWAAHKDVANGTMINSDNVLLLRPASPNSGFGAPKGHRAQAGTKVEMPGLFVATICYLAPHTDQAFAEFFESTLRPILQADGARVEATFVAEKGPNTFPRLPVREGETVFVWLSSFPSLMAYAEHLEALTRSNDWTTLALPEMDRRTWRTNEVFRLTPTGRSLLHA
jgi:hypothetical protein